VKQLFRREATAIAKLNHPYILPLYRFGESTIDTIPMMYMVMPYCQEKSLTDWMYAHGKTILSPQEVEHILLQAAEALQYAHDQKIIHLDVKLTNFLVRYHADDANKLTLQLADFGVAKFTGTTGMSQSVRGSLEFMAPEQWEGQPVFATDQYALAIMVYKLLTGQSAFKGMGFEQLWHQHRYIQPQPPSAINPRIPPSIDGVLLRALAKNPNDRFPSVMAFADTYRQALQISPTEYIPIQQALMLSPEEASRGTTRTVILPSGEPLAVSISPGAYQGQVIRIARQSGPMVMITVQIPTVVVPPPPPYIPSSLPPLPPPQVPSRPNTQRNRAIVLAIVVLVLIIGGSVVGFSAYNNQQHNMQLTATAQAGNQATQDALNAQQTVDAQATISAQQTQSAQPNFPNIQGSYSGSYQFSTDSSSSPMLLNITSQSQQNFGGTCSLNGTAFPIVSGTVDTSGNITFTINAVDTSGTNVAVTFMGNAQSSGGWQGTFSVTNNTSGMWSAM
jgi:eukaryotic-like serine/threonine-protein kinase